MSKPDEPIFVNDVSVSGFLNGVLNVSFVRYRWRATMGDKGQTVVATDVDIPVDLRMDLHCAQQLRAALDNIIEQNTKSLPPEEVN